MLGDEINPAAIGNEIAASLFDNDKVIAKWSAAFGEDNVRIRVFERKQLVREDVVADFLSVLDCDDLTASAPPAIRRNPSLDVRSLEYLRRINVFFPPHVSAADNRRRPALISALEQISDGVGLCMRRSAAGRLLDRYRDGNSWIARRYLGRCDGRLFQEEPDNELEQPPYLAIDDSIEIGARLWAIANNDSEQAMGRFQAVSPL